MTILKEACVGNFKEAKKSYELGAERIELCDNLGGGGTTPSLGTIQAAKKYLDMSISVIIRPREGNFVFNQDEIEIMVEDIRLCKSIGVDGVVIGALTEDNKIDEDTIKVLLREAKGMETTFHMAFDLIEDKKSALDKLVELGFTRVLTKGGLKPAVDNLDTLKELVDYAGNRITILPGGGITKDNYMGIVDRTGVQEVHGTKIVGNLNQI